MRSAAFLVLLVFAPAPLVAEWVRVPVGGVETRGIPASWDRVERRAEQMFGIAWTNPARWEPNYTWNASATVGTMSVVDAAGVTTEVTWLEFETAHAASEYAEMMLSSWGADSYYQVRVEGTRVMTAYPYDYELMTSNEVLDALSGR